MPVLPLNKPNQSTDYTAAIQYLAVSYLKAHVSRWRARVGSEDDERAEHAASIIHSFHTVGIQRVRQKTCIHEVSTYRCIIHRVNNGLNMLSASFSFHTTGIQWARQWIYIQKVPTCGCNQPAIKKTNKKPPENPVTDKETGDTILHCFPVDPAFGQSTSNIVDTLLLLLSWIYFCHRTYFGSVIINTRYISNIII